MIGYNIQGLPEILCIFTNIVPLTGPCDELQDMCTVASCLAGKFGYN